MLEHKQEPLVPLSVFLQRMMHSAGLSVGMLAMILAIGTFNLCLWEKFSVLDAFLNSVLIMTGLGLVNPVVTVSGKLFTAFYALISALVFYSALAVFFTPLLHRLLHRFHLEHRNGH